MKIALAQINLCVGDLVGNTARITATIARSPSLRAAAPGGADT